MFAWANNKCFVMMVVEGESVTAKTKTGKEKRFNYAETFIIPAAAWEFELVNNGKPSTTFKHGCRFWLI